MSKPDPSMEQPRRSAWRTMRFWPLAALFVTIASLPETPPAAAQTQPGWEIGPELYYYDYEESGAALRGPFLGGETAYTWKRGTMFLRAEGFGDIGYINYSSPSSGSDGGIWDFKGEFRGLAGNDFYLRDGLVATPYLGLGYRILLDKEGGTTTNAGFAGYDRLSQYLYLPVGLTFGIASGAWTIKPSAEFDLLIQGWQTSYLSQVGFDNDMTNPQHHGYGIRGSLMFERPTPYGYLSFGPFLRYWNIRSSALGTLYVGGQPYGQGYEPQNYTIEAGLSVKFGF